MKKKIFLSLLLVLTIFSLTGCSKKKPNFKLKIKESSWSGWSEDYVPEETTYEYEVKEGKEYKRDGSKFTFTIKKVNKDSIVIKTTEPFSDHETGVDLRSKKVEFTIQLDKETKLVTPTMDFGYIYYLTLTK